MPFILPCVVLLLAQEQTLPVAPGPAGLVVRSGLQNGPLRNLAQALPSLTWKVTERGPLMVVGGEKVQIPNMAERMQKQTLPTTPLPDTPAKAIADLFAYRVEKVGTLHALVPTKLKRFRGAPDLSTTAGAFLEQNDLAQELGYSLSKEQWAKLGSANGLGMSDLTSDQQALFLELLAGPMRIHPMEPPEDGPGYIELTLEQRTQIRLRIERQLQVSYLGPGSEIMVRFGDDLGRKNRTFSLEYLKGRKAHSMIGLRL